jgi:hypothetical protein
MAQMGTLSMSDYINDYEKAYQDYAEMGPLWAEMVFGDDFEAIKAVYGRRGKQDSRGNSVSYKQDSRAAKRH